MGLVPLLISAWSEHPDPRKTGVNGTKERQCYTRMSTFMKIAERRILEAVKNGEFDSIPGQGEPLDLKDESHIPEDLRLAYKILKNADCLPPELEAKKEIRQMEDLLESAPDEKERYKLIKRINYQIMKLNMMGKKSPLLEEQQIYYNKVADKIAKK
jgi:hypothetical protein